MTTHPGSKTRTLTPEQIAQCAQLLEHLLKPGYSLVRTKQRYYLRRWDSWLTRDGTARMTWADVDNDRDLATLLGRLGGQP